MTPREHQRFLGVYPSQRGFAYAALERGRGVIDWGESELISRTDEEFQYRFERQIQRSRPTVLALEDLAVYGRVSGARQRTLIAAGRPRGEGPAVRMISRIQIRKTLDLPLVASKHDVAERLCERFPEVARLRPVRSTWKKDRRMNVFDVIALAVAALDNSD